MNRPVDPSGTNGLSNMMDAIHLDGLETMSTDELAEMLKSRLNVQGKDHSYYREIAVFFRDISLKDKPSNNDGSPVSDRSNQSNQENRPASMEATAREMDRRANNGTPSRLFQKVSRPWDSSSSNSQTRSTPHTRQVPSGRRTPLGNEKPSGAAATASSRSTKAATTASSTTVKDASPRRQRPQSPFRNLFRRGSSKSENNSGVKATPFRNGRDSPMTDKTTTTPAVPPAALQTPREPLSYRASPIPDDSPFSPLDTPFEETTPKPFTTTTNSTAAAASVHRQPSVMNKTPVEDTQQKEATFATGAHKQRRKTHTPVGFLAKCVTTAAPSPPKPEAPFQVNLEGGFTVGAGERKPKGRLRRDRTRKKTATAAKAVPTQINFASFSKNDETKVSSSSTSVPSSSFPSVSTTFGDATKTTTPAAQPSPLFSPMDIDNSPRGTTPNLETKFHIGAGSTNKSPRSRKTPARVMGTASTRRRRHRMPMTDDSVRRTLNLGVSPPQPEGQNGLGSFESPTGPGPTFSFGSASKSPDYSGRPERVAALRKDASTQYRQGEYKKSVLLYTEALEIHGDSNSAYGKPDDVKAVLLANRAAALLMLGAYQASWTDCFVAQQSVSTLADPRDLSTEGGPILKSKLFIRMGRALLKLGRLDEAEAAFKGAAETVEGTMAICGDTKGSDEPGIKSLNDASTDATYGQTDVKRCRENMDVLGKCGLNQPSDAQTASRRVCLRALSCVNMALSLASGSDALHEMKVALFASLKRWRELLLHCERYAAETVKFDGVFVGKLADRNPRQGVREAVVLKADVFDKHDGAAEIAAVKLTSKAVAEVVVRLPIAMASLYMRGLRLEERYHNAQSAGAALENVVRQHGRSDQRVHYTWLSREMDKLERTTSTKDKGDSLFRSGEYQAAAERYGDCLRIDAEGLPSEGNNEGNGGGRLHAVLFCNRAAAYMALVKYRLAIADCTSALRIHTHYMKAMLRRSRCYVRLNRLDEASVEYERYIELVTDARKKNGDSTTFKNTPCVFDGPKDVSEDDLETVRQELRDVKESKTKAERTAKAEAAQRDQRQRWHSEAFRQGDTQTDAQWRRQQWYNDQSSSSRRWDSFGGRGPNRSKEQTWREQKQEQYGGTSSNGARYSYRHESYSSNQERTVQSPRLGDSTDHYNLLKISREASDAQIKKAYRQMALKYHPDKNQEDGAADMFRRIKMAYDVLNDPEARRKYDNEIRWSRRY